ncbi:MarR family winged helix-turn-helix transcriptional regulator [Amycolatopsis sp. cmx-11-51]|uniref:MarR family winged helix-turn-helix transcriptional regulator n=1 Tax=Amycolatopsis sp. cmx-11-51 TaxID=2785797 RepID=UPI0039E2DD97
MQNEAGGEIADALGVLLRRATRIQLYKTLTADVDEALDELTYPVLSAVARIGPRSAADLASEVGLDRSGVTRHASRLEQAGLLCREPDPFDRRATLLVLTEPGARVVDELRRRLAAHITASLTTWPPGEAQTFARGLRRFVTEGPFT